LAALESVEPPTAMRSITRQNAGTSIALCV
jgi:hypothetical protein